MIGDKDIQTVITGIRPGEKRHEIMLSDEEIPRTVRRGKYFVLQPLLPNQRSAAAIETPVLDRELSSADYVMPRAELKAFLIQGGYI